jgi:tetratricopeptide (TPR) repeat protein
VILETLAATDPTWARPDTDIGTLEENARGASGEQRAWANRQLAMACLWASESAPSPRVAIMHRRCALKAARAVARGAPPRLAAQMELVDLWVLVRGEDRAARRMADRYPNRHASERELLGVAWLVRGELELAGGQFEEAARAYRFVVGEIDHPLYAVALYRTAQCYRQLGRSRDADQALREVAALGRAAGATAQVRRVAAAARSELGGR